MYSPFFLIFVKHSSVPNSILYPTQDCCDTCNWVESQSFLLICLPQNQGETYQSNVFFSRFHIFQITIYVCKVNIWDVIAFHNPNKPYQWTWYSFAWHLLSWPFFQRLPYSTSHTHHSFRKNWIPVPRTIVQIPNLLQIPGESHN